MSQFLALCLLSHHCDMKGCSVWMAVGLATLAIGTSDAAVSSSFPALNNERNGTRTNWTDNTVTNIIEVRMSRNRFINEFRTNWLDNVTTNVVDTYRTNHLTRNLTNSFVIDAWRTNSVDA